LTPGDNVGRIAFLLSRSDPFSETVLKLLLVIRKPGRRADTVNDATHLPIEPSLPCGATVSLIGSIIASAETVLKLLLVLCRS
jgi:hypothetical protein